MNSLDFIQAIAEKNVRHAEEQSKRAIAGVTKLGTPKSAVSVVHTIFVAQFPSPYI
jgi:hypothetical protein